MKVAIIGSGLTAVAAAKSLIACGVKPVILDTADNIEPEREKIISSLAEIAPDKWDDDDRDFITANPTVYVKDDLPQKLAFGSDYFYGKSREHAAVESYGAIPPFSYAKGGFSTGWGATVLPPDDSDLIGWPIKNNILRKFYEQVLLNLPYSARNDELSLNFPLSYANYAPLDLTIGDQELLKSMGNSGVLCKDKLVFGQSRLLVRAHNTQDGLGCSNCGYCMSGCVYGCIYKSSQDIDNMLHSGSIEYEPEVLVQDVQEQGNTVTVSYVNKTGATETILFDRVFLAAGAVNSTRIVLRSKKLYDQKVMLKSTVGFVVPMLRIKRTRLDWPHANTQPGIFLEYKVPGLANHWVHTQLSTPNEMVFARLNIHPGKPGFIQMVKRRFAEHLFVALCNMHSEYANGYELELKRSADQDVLVSRRLPAETAKQAVKKAAKQLSVIGRKIGCYPLLGLMQDSTISRGYHIGGTMPITLNPKSELDTNITGTPKGLSRVHIVDSSIFPSIPGTTIGLLAMANAARIVSELKL